MQKMRKLLLTLALAIIISTSAYLLWQAHGGATNQNTDTLYQIAPFNTFSTGQYDGNTTYSELAKHGDFGIGTLNALDGEMVALDGVFYQVPYDGNPKQIPNTAKTPYATVTFFEADQTLQLTESLNYSQLQSYLDTILPSGDAIYAIKVYGTYEQAKTRSVPIQTQPYPPIDQAVANQSVFNLQDVSATAVGFWFPQSMNGVDYAGYHLHFITDDHTAGGHLLDCQTRNVTIELDQINKYELNLP